MLISRQKKKTGDFAGGAWRGPRSNQSTDRHQKPPPTNGKSIDSLLPKAIGDTATNRAHSGTLLSPGGKNGEGAVPARNHPTAAYFFFSRARDVLISATALALFSPLMVLIAIAIRLETPGPALFKHKRIGLNRRTRAANGNATTIEATISAGCGGNDRRKEQLYGQPFYFYKFRTMYADSRDRYPELYSYEYTDEALEALPIKALVGTAHDRSGFDGDEHYESDPRITRVGYWLRRTSLDELPNIINVLLGDISLVGPRPDIAENVRWYQPEHLEILNSKPGVTGLAQVEGRGTLPFHRINELDLIYLNNRSFLNDIKILVKTVWVTIKRHGAY